MYIGFDLFIVVVLTVFGGMCLFTEVTMNCKSSNPLLLEWWIISMCMFVYGVVYSLLLCIGLTSLPFILIFWCFYSMQMRDIRNQTRIANIPIAGNILAAFTN